MSDDRFMREPGDDGDEEEVPGKPYVDPKPRNWYTPKPPFDLATECEKFLAEYCAKFGIKPKAKKGKYSL